MSRTEKFTRKGQLNKVDMLPELQTPESGVEKAGGSSRDRTSLTHSCTPAFDGYLQNYCSVLFKDENVLLCTNVFQNLRPNRYADFTDMGFL